MNKYKLLLIPGVSILILIAVYFFAGNYIIGRINSLNADLELAKANEVKLQAKLALLQNNQATVDSFRDKVVYTLPGTNNSLVSLSQTKNLAETNNLILSNISVKQDDPKSSQPKTTVSFDSDGSIESIFALAKQLQTTDPVTTIDKFKLINAGGTSRGSFSVSFYWAALPTKFPSVVEPEKELTKDELDLLAKISNFLVPEFVNADAARPSSVVREDPFDFSGTEAPDEEVVASPSANVNP